MMFWFIIVFYTIFSEHEKFFEKIRLVWYNTPESFKKKFPTHNQPCIVCELNQLRMIVSQRQWGNLCVCVLKMIDVLLKFNKKNYQQNVVIGIHQVIAEGALIVRKEFDGGGLLKTKKF